MKRTVDSKQLKCIVHNPNSKNFVQLLVSELVLWMRPIDSIKANERTDGLQASSPSRQTASAIMFLLRGWLIVKKLSGFQIRSSFRIMAANARGDDIDKAGDKVLITLCLFTSCYKNGLYFYYCQYHFFIFNFLCPMLIGGDCIACSRSILHCRNFFYIYAFNSEWR